MGLLRAQGEKLRCRSMGADREEGSGRFQKGHSWATLSTQAHLHGPNQVHGSPVRLQTKPRVWGTFSASTTGRREHGFRLSPVWRWGAGPPLSNAHSLPLSDLLEHTGGRGRPACVTRPCLLVPGATSQVPHGSPCLPNHCLSLSGSENVLSPPKTTTGSWQHRDPQCHTTPWTHIRDSAGTNGSLR